MDDTALERAAALLVECRARRSTIDGPTTFDSLSLTDAYRVQLIVTANRLARGERVIGWKLGYTSIAMREQMGVSEPNFGPLTDVMLLDDGGTVPRTLIQPRVEPEIAFRFGRALSADDGEITRAAVFDAVESVHACLEVVDSVWANYRFSLAQNTADGSSAAGVVIGPRLDADDLEAVEVALAVDGAPAGNGIGADASGHPADGVVWLLGRLGRAGLRAGDVVITGGLTRAVPLESGGLVTARFSGGGLPEPVEVSVRGA